ncbi:MAG: MFS transporter [Alphaproteobacteria bacterium]
MSPELRRNSILLILAASLAISLSMGMRSTFGLFQEPMTTDLGIGRESFAFAMALQQLLWGLFQPICGMIADRYGSGRVLVAGAGIYALGLYVMAGAETTLGLNIGGGWLIGFAMAATSFSVVLGALGRLVPPEKQSMAFGIASAGGSVGQFVMSPLGQGFIETEGWSSALMTMAGLATLIALAAVVLQSKAGDEISVEGAAPVHKQSMREALGEAYDHVGYRYLSIGFFVCGFQVSFLTMHLPAYLRDSGFDAGTGAIALALIGFFNIVGTYGCGVLGGRYPKKYLLSLLYFLRSIIVMLFLIAPISEISVYLFSASMGLLWLGTVPLTSGLVAQIFGTRYISTLFALVFLSHQLGSFIGVWLGGYLYDTTGNYDGIWYGSVALGIAAALLHLPIRETPLRPIIARAES